MPWKIGKRKGATCVLKDDGTMVHCYTGSGARGKAGRLLAALYANEPEAEGKSLSMETQARRVRMAWEDEFAPATGPDGVPEPADHDEPRWVQEIYEDRIIVSASNGCLFAYPYTLSADGVEFGEPVEVEVEYRPVRAAAEGKAVPLSVRPPYAVKTLRTENGGVVVGGYLCLWGSPERKDLQGDYFTPATETWHDRYPTVPALFHHGLDDSVGLATIGKRVKAAPDATGLWVEDWLDASNQYWKMVKPLLDAEALFYSPGSAPHLVKRAADGQLLSFPVVEDTLTPVPAQPRLRPIAQVAAAYKAAGLEIPADLTPGDADTGDAGASRPADPARERVRARLEIELAQLEILSEV